MEVKLVPITEENLDQAIDIGVRIFGETDREGLTAEFRASAGRQAELDLIESDLHITKPKYYIFTNDSVPTGVVGSYRIKDHEDDAWLGWFGVLPELRGGGLARSIITETFNTAAKEPGVKTVRFYTTLEEKHKIAHDLYIKMGFIEEAYRPEAEDAASMIVVFSKGAAPEYQTDEYLWKNIAYPIDCDKYVIPEMNEHWGFNKGKQDETPPDAPKGPRADHNPRP